MKAIYSGADMTKPAEIAEMIATTEKTFGAVDVLVNNAGIQFVAKVEDFPIEKWDAVIATNLSAAFHTTRVAIPGMKKRKWGRIINIASAHGLVASGEKAAYVAAKHGIVGLTKVVAIEAANDGITCNAICPGWVLTPLVAQQIEARAKAAGQTFERSEERRSSPKSSRCWNSPRRRTSARSRCSSPAMPPRPSPARPTRSTAAGPRNNSDLILRRPRKRGVSKDGRTLRASALALRDALRRSSG